MQANPLIKLDEENLVESAFEHFHCPAEIVVPYELYDPASTDAYTAYHRSRFIPSIWNMDSPWMMSIFGTLGLNFIAFLGTVCLRNLLFSSGHWFGFAFSLLAIASLAGIPFTYAALVYFNLRTRYGKYWWRKLLGPTHVGITELGFKLYMRGSLFYNYPNLAVWKDISDVDVVYDTRYNVPSITYKINSNYTFKNVMLPITGFHSQSHLLLVLQHLREHVDKLRQSERFVDLANMKYEPLLEEYRKLTSVPVEAS